MNDHLLNTGHTERIILQAENPGKLVIGQKGRLTRLENIGLCIHEGKSPSIEGVPGSGKSALPGGRARTGPVFSTTPMIVPRGAG